MTMDNGWVSFSAWLRDEATIDKALATPIRVLWRSYLAYCNEWGFTPCEANEFAPYLSLEEGLQLKIGGAGRLRRVVVGIGPSKEVFHHARYA